MNKLAFGLFGALSMMGIITGCAGTPTQAVAVVSPAVPPPMFRTHPPIVIIADAPDVYYIPGNDNLFFSFNSWYYYCNDQWFISSSYNGPWVFIEYEVMPMHIRNMPPGHLKPPLGHMKESSPPPAHHKAPPAAKKDKPDRKKDTPAKKDKSDSPDKKGDRGKDK